MTDVPIGYLSPEKMRLVWETIKEIRSSGLLKNSSAGRIADDPGLHQVRVYNNSGEEVPEFACMQIVDTEIVEDVTYLKITKPTSTTGKYIFNNASKIAIGSRGIGHTWDIVRMLGSGAATPLASYGATVGAWTIQEQSGGPFTVYGDDAVSGVYKGRIESTGTSDVEIVEFEFDTPYEAEDVPALCSDRIPTEEAYHSVTVVKHLCGKSSPAFGEVDGHINVYDDLSLLTDRDYRDLYGRKGIAVLMSGSEACQWVIVYIDFHRTISVIHDIVFGTDSITISRKLVKVWDDCDMPDEEILGADCTPPTDY